MSDATTAAKAIQERHKPRTFDGLEDATCDQCGDLHGCLDREDAGVVLARLREAIALLDDAASYKHFAGRELILSALACLRNEDA